MINLDGSIDERTDSVGDSERMLKLKFETHGKQGDMRFFFKVEDIGQGKEFKGILGNRDSLLKYEKATKKGITMLFIDIYGEDQSPESIIVIDDVVVYFKKKMALLSKTLMTARDNESDFQVIIVKIRRVYMVVKVTMIDKCCILEGFAVKFRRFCDSWLFFRDHRRCWNMSRQIDSLVFFKLSIKIC